MINPLMMVYWLKYIFKPQNCKNEDNCLYLWSSWVELIEGKYNDESLKAGLKPIEDYIDNYEKVNESLFAKTLL